MDEREQMLNVLFHESADPMYESEELEEGVLQNVKNTVSNAVQKGVNNAKAAVKTGIANLKPAITQQQKAKKAANIANIQQAAADKNNMLDAKLAAQKAGGNAQKQAGADYKKYSQEFTKADNIQKAWAAAGNSLDDYVKACCATYAALQIYGSKDGMKSQADAMKQKNKNDEKETTDNATKEVDQKFADENKGNEALEPAKESTVKWEAYKMFTLREDNMGKYAKQGMINLLSNYYTWKANPSDEKLTAKLKSVLADASTNLVSKAEQLNSAQNDNGKAIFDGETLKKFYGVIKANQDAGSQQLGTLVQNAAKAAAAEGGQNGEDPNAAAQQDPNAKQPAEVTPATTDINTGDKEVDNGIEQILSTLDKDQLAMFAKAAVGALIKNGGKWVPPTPQEVAKMITIKGPEGQPAGDGKAPAAGGQPAAAPANGGGAGGKAPIAAPAAAPAK